MPYYLPVTTDPGERRLPSAQDEQDFWALIEEAWVAADPQAGQARRALANRDPSTEPDTATVNGALE